MSNPAHSAESGRGPNRFYREPSAERDVPMTDLRQRLYVAFVEQRVIDSQKYGEAPYAPITWADVDRALALPPALPDPHGGCICPWYPPSRDPAEPHISFPAEQEYEPACPVHSHHVYNPRTGAWDLVDNGAEDALAKVRVLLDDPGVRHLQPANWRSRVDAALNPTRPTSPVRTD